MIAIQHLAPGTRLRLTDGSLVAVAENPKDGMWLIVRPLAPDAAEPGSGEGELVGLDEIAEVLPG